MKAFDEGDLRAFDAVPPEGGAWPDRLAAAAWMTAFLLIALPLAITMDAKVEQGMRSVGLPLLLLTLGYRIGRRRYRRLVAALKGLDVEGTLRERLGKALIYGPSSRLTEPGDPRP